MRVAFLTAASWRFKVVCKSTVLSLLLVVWAGCATEGDQAAGSPALESEATTTEQVPSFTVDTQVIRLPDTAAVVR